jgi:tetratricopeptide (TPR) repeat protein
LLAKIYEDQDSAKATDELVAAAKLNPGDEQTWLELGSQRRVSGDETGALAAFQHAVSCDPKDAEAQYEVGSQYLVEGDAHPAVIHLEMARQQMPRPTIAVLYKLDRALRLVGRNQEAEAVRAQAKLLLAQDSDAHEHNQQAEELEHEGLALEDSGDLTHAVRKLEAALEINPEQNRFRYNYALVLCHLGRWPEGIAELNEVLENDPGNVDARRALFIAKDKARQASGQPRAQAQ